MYAHSALRSTGRRRYDRGEGTGPVPLVPAGRREPSIPRSRERGDAHAAAPAGTVRGRDPIMALRAPASGVRVR